MVKVAFVTFYLVTGIVAKVWEGGVSSDDILHFNTDANPQIEYYKDGVDDFHEGDRIYALMNDMGTPDDPSDDEAMYIGLLQ